MQHMSTSNRTSMKLSVGRVMNGAAVRRREAVALRLAHIRAVARAMRPDGLFPGVQGPGEGWVLS